MFTVGTAKFIISQAAGMCSGTVVKHIIRNNVSPASKAESIQIAIGTFAIGGFVSDKIMRNTSEHLDNIERIVRENQDKLNAQ